MKRIISFLIVVILALSGQVIAQSGESSFDFLLIGPGSRAAAMGEAYTAISGDAGAPYFNPASAALMDGTEFSLMHVKYLTDVTMEHFSVIAHSKRFHYGLGLYYGKVANIERRDVVPTDQPLGTFDEHNFTASFLWALPLNDRLAIGNTIKWAYEKIDINSASALGLDFGAFYTLRPEIALGVSVRNLGTQPKFDSVSFDLPRELRIGASYRMLPETKLAGLILSSDFIVTKWGNKKSKLNIGGEYTYQDLISLRMGYGFGYDSRNFSLGGGITYTNYYFEYAFVPSNNNLNDTHRFTLRIRM